MLPIRPLQSRTGIALACLMLILLSHTAMAQRDTVYQIDSVVVHALTYPSWNRTLLSKHHLLQRNTQSLGESLSAVSGVQNSYYGPHAGAPMIRSLSGNRVRILRNNTSVSDMSGISPNLTVSFEPDQISDIQIYKSQATVLYGGRAIGGAVNIMDNSIPKEVPSTWISGSVKTTGHTNAGHQLTFDLTGKANKTSSWHIDGTWRKNGHIRIPGHSKIDWAYSTDIDDLQAAMAQVYVDKESKQNITLFPYLSQYTLDHIKDPNQDLSTADLYTFETHSTIGGYKVPNPGNPDYIPNQDANIPLYTTIVHGIYDYHPVAKGQIPNSHADHKSINMGYAWHTEKLQIGLGYRGNQGYFGIPGFAQISQPRHSHNHEGGHVHQTAYSGYSPINTRSLSNTIFSDVSVKVGAPWLSLLKNSYSVQFADDRELLGIYQMNKFESQLHNNRIEVHQSYQGFWHALHGADLSFRKIVGNGIMRYMPHTRSREWSVFTQHYVAFKNLRASTGYRLEHAYRQALLDSNYKRSRGLSGGNLSPRSFKLQQFNSEITWQIFPFIRVMGSYQYSERAPEVNELYAGNNHFAIMIEENGDDRLHAESNKGFEFGLELTDLYGWFVKSTYYHNHFNNYLYLAHTGISRSGGFLVKEWRASDSKVSGWEIEIQKKLTLSEKIYMHNRAYFDLVKNRNTSNDQLRQWAEGDFMPNMPSSRLGFSTEVEAKKWSIYLAADQHLKQKLLGKNINPEPPMPAFLLVHAKVGYKIPWIKQSLSAFIQGSNLLNSEARPQQSILKYLTPLPGRNISIGIQLNI